MIIDTENLNGLSLHEVALLLLLYDPRTDKSRSVMQVRDIDIIEVLDRLQDKGYIMATVYSTDFDYKPPYQHIAWALLERGKNVLAENCVQNNPVKKALTRTERNRCDALALKLMELYPVGKKPGTSLQWRGYKNGVSEQLQKIIKEGNEFTDAEAIAVTKAYISYFNGNYTNMRVLPYFLGKTEIIGGEVKRTCDFLSYLEDLRNNPKQFNLSADWNVELR